jgi:hypothetical protein
MEITYRVRVNNQEESVIVQQFLLFKGWSHFGKKEISKYLYSDGYNRITAWSDQYVTFGSGGTKDDISFDEFINKMDDEMP